MKMNMIPTIALIGRSNVGKSTLFNHLTCTHDALVTDFPGQTRDRKYGCAEIKGHKFICIDTAGINETKEDLEKYAIGQSILAIKTADIVLLLLDARTGLMPADIMIAKLLRCHNKITFLVANKIDGIDPNQAIADFWKLSMGDIHPIAALYGRGVANLMKKVLLHFTDKDSFTDEEAKYLTQFQLHKKIKNKLKDNIDSLDIPIKVAIVGRRNVGKSTLTNCILGKNRVVVYSKPGTTRDSIYIPMQYKNHKYIFIDTAGIYKRSKISEITEKFSIIQTFCAIKDANVVILLISAHEPISDQDLSLLNFILKSGRSLLIVVNKCDNLNQKIKNQIKEILNHRISFIGFARIHFISALYNKGINNLFKSIHEAHNNATKKIKSSTLTRIMTMAAKNRPLPIVYGHRIKLKYAHIGGYNPPIIVFHGNQLKYLTNSYKRYLINYFHKSLNLIGTPIRLHFKNDNN